MVLPIGDEAAEQVRAAEQRAVGGSRAAERDMVAAAGADVAAVQQEFFGAETHGARFVAERENILGKLVPVRRWMDVDFDHPGIGRDVQYLEAWVERRPAAFEPNAEAELLVHPLD